MEKLKECKPANEKHVLRSFMQWSGISGDKNYIPRDLLPGSFNVYPGVTVIQRSCYNWWFCGSPVEWTSTSGKIPYCRMGYELTGIVESPYWKGRYICPCPKLPEGRGSQGLNYANVGIPELIEYINEKVLDQNPDAMKRFMDKFVKETFR